LDNATVYNIH